VDSEDYMMAFVDLITIINMLAIMVTTKRLMSSYDTEMGEIIAIIKIITSFMC
jgi:hypothetical protein